MASALKDHPSRITPHEHWMRLALRLAAKGRGKVEPNPMVGAVLVKDGRLVGQGYHKRYGGPHAEPNALRDAGAQAEGATLYVSLEPCAHYGKTPPCVDAVIRAGIATVVAAVRDPSPAANGKGIRKLRRAGIEVVERVLAEEAAELNAAFFKWVRTGRPLVTLKWAMTLDGKIATRTGDSKWITGEAARRCAHRLRAHNQAILVGIETVLHDDPLLTCRVPRGRNLLRIVLDSKLRTPLHSQLIKTVAEAPVLIATLRSATSRKRQRLEAAGAEVVALRQKKARVDLGALLDLLGQRGVSTLLVEGGSEVHGAFCDARLVDRVAAFVAPKVIGGADAKPAVAGSGARLVTQGIRLRPFTWRRLGEDLVAEAPVVR